MAATRLSRSCWCNSFSRGLPISIGWKNAAAVMVVKSEIAKSLPMLEVPGSLEK